MQRLGGLSLSHVFPLRIPTSNIQIRFKSHRRRRPWPDRNNLPLRKNCITFEASNLLLDLDAEDNSYVRPYDEDIDGELASSEYPSTVAFRPVRKHVARFERISKKLSDKYNATMKRKFNCWHISDYDILSVALDNISTTNTAELPSKDDKSHSNESINDVFEQNGIPSHARTNFSTAVAYMLRRQQLVRRQPTGFNDTRLFKKALEDCPDLFTLERLITNTFQAPQGCELISSCGDALARTVSIMINNTSPSKVLSFLNNLIINFKSRESHIKPSLVWLAYLLALRCRAFTTAQKYLNIIRNDEDSIYNNHGVFETLQVLEKSIAPVIPDNPESYIERDTIPQLLAIYGLLTGRVLGEEMRQASFHEVIFKNDIETFQLYVSCLARLGCFRTLWYIWHTHREDALETPKEAFSIALQNAFKTNSRLAELAEAPHFAHTANQFNGDCQLDMENIVQSADTISTRDHGQFYPFNPGDVATIFGKTSIEEAMLALKSYLRWNTPSHVVDHEVSSPIQNQGSGL
ncbi:hypothetical protein K449DRAFT_430988 [Hypoxylon sp. EC38]|nr:hypothetical protein K449DRAFT_430988 [Hypoxylon sp. EC38]